MKNSFMVKLKPLLLSLVISLGVGALSGFLTRGSMQAYSGYAKPPLSPPGWVFAVVWTLLYLLMGISAYLVYMQKQSPARRSALIIYGVQLAVNFVWPLLFFNFGLLLPAFFWLLLLLALVLWMIFLFYCVQPTAAFLQLPYFFWLLFAAYLNLGIYLMNR